MSERRTLSLRASVERKAAPRQGWNVSETRLARLKDMAREQRRHPTDAETALWERLSGQQLGGFKFHRQVVVGSTIVDFACPARWLVVEIANGTTAEFDLIQDRKLTDVGIRVLRFSPQQVVEDCESVVTAILAELEKHFDRRAERAANAAGRPRAEADAAEDRAEDEALFDTAEEGAE